LTQAEPETEGYNETVEALVVQSRQPEPEIRLDELPLELNQTAVEETKTEFAVERREGAAALGEEEPLPAIPGDNATIDPTRISLSIPSNTIRKIAPALIETGSYQHPWLGISGWDMTPEIAEAIDFREPRGFLVTEAAPGGPADAAGVQGGNTSVQYGGREIPIGGDVILALDDRDVRGLNDLLGYLEQSTQIGDEVTLIVWRDGQTIEIPVTLGARPSLQGSP
jgi:hypothetical protein